MERYLHRVFVIVTSALCVVLLALLSVPTASAQEFSEWSAPKALDYIHVQGFNDQHPAISKDGLSLYISSNRLGGSGKLDIWVSQRPNSESDWGPPQHIPNINSSEDDLAPNLSPDGHYLYFHSTRSGGCGAADLYVSHRQNKGDDLGWEAPVNLGCEENGTGPNSQFNDAGPTIFEDDSGTTFLYFTRNLSTSVPPPTDGWDVYVSTRNDDGQFSPAVKVEELSSAYRDTRTAIRRDGLEMFLSSGRLGSVGTVRNEDIWVSTRTSTSLPWGPPVNLGPVVNSPFFDGAPALSWDGTTLYFFSERAPGGPGNRYLWVTTRTKLGDAEDSSETPQ